VEASSGIKAIKLEAMYGHQNISVQLKPGLNIVHGRNGAGKTTLLHVLANLLEHDLERFCYVRFSSIRIVSTNDVEIEIRQNRTKEIVAVELFLEGKSIGEVKRGEETSAALQIVLEERLGGRPVYLPAFRAVLEAAYQTRRTPYYAPESEYSRQAFTEIVARELARLETKSSITPRHSRRDRSESVAHKTLLCRTWFGEFVPLVRYPSIWEVAREINAELQQARLEIASKDQEALSDVFVNVLDSLLKDKKVKHDEDIEPLIQRVISNLSNLEPGHAGLREASSKVRDLLISHAGELSSAGEFLGNVLRVYDQALRQRAEFTQRALSRLRRFEESVNRFLQDKRLSLEHLSALRTAQAYPIVRLGDGSPAKLEVLSSGERHVLTLLFSATHMTPEEGLVLIDEPELSLHVEWQRLILGELIKQAGGRQVIACTHAPEVAAEHSSALVEIEVGNSSSAMHSQEIDDLDEEA
jgi:ABC-type cobalamin/Fe3+-siderophores transport system ATPase subunit